MLDVPHWGLAPRPMSVIINYMVVRGPIRGGLIGAFLPGPGGSGGLPHPRLPRPRSCASFHGGLAVECGDPRSRHNGFCGLPRRPVVPTGPAFSWPAVAAPVMNCTSSAGLSGFGGGGPFAGRHRRRHDRFLHAPRIAGRAGQTCPPPPGGHRRAVAKPALEFVAVLATQTVNDHRW